jgi:hypothetical protein
MCCFAMRAQLDLNLSSCFSPAGPRASNISTLYSGLPSGDNEQYDTIWKNEDTTLWVS